MIGLRELVVAGLLLSLLPATPAASYESGRTPLTLEVNDDLQLSYEVFAVYVLPGERLWLSAAGATADADGGQLTTVAPGEYQWVAPAQPGVARLRFSSGEHAIRLNAVILHPATRIENGNLFGYRVGEYPNPLNGNPVYRAPDGFIELKSELVDLELSPHFTLGQFPSKQSNGYPKFLVLRENLLLKLELLLERLNEAGVEAESFTVMSGYRTPIYNRSIGNGRHSRHIYGGAADIYVDVSPRDGVMDDLNGDGALDVRDAQWLYRLANQLFGRPEHAALRGGLGVYRANPAHGPFIHVDARGNRARWGLLP